MKGADFFVHLLDMGVRWQPAAGAPGVYEGHDRETERVRWTATRVDRKAPGSPRQVPAVDR